MIKYEELSGVKEGIIAVRLKSLSLFIIGCLLIPYFGRIGLSEFLVNVILAISVLYGLFIIAWSNNKNNNFFPNELPMFNQKINGYQIVDLDLNITSIETSDGRDIMDLRYDSELQLIDKFYLDTDDYPDSNFILVREDYNSNMIDFVLEVYRVNGEVGIKLDKESKDIDYRYLQYREKLENIDDFNILNDKVYEYFEVEEIVK